MSSRKVWYVLRPSISRVVMLNFTFGYVLGRTLVHGKPDNVPLAGRAVERSFVLSPRFADDGRATIVRMPGYHGRVSSIHLRGRFSTTVRPLVTRPCPTPSSSAKRFVLLRAGQGSTSEPATVSTETAAVTVKSAERNVRRWRCESRSACTNAMVCGCVSCSGRCLSPAHAVESQCMGYSQGLNVS
ncbi:uncharacterized protein PHACADRAFT_250327 [Phanerochaete carnosa HHB-10118-sp]|uniref:Uncharacterized protein n=1 Tax=Phanerochaete carnosa (strain HHB-10118-sp) TaxID=650164 RepID=K5WJU3_PHACS|nr:uncharacterized protein PHACADRAFT_250327 [Phanerochaete carnosa HHB-10118-sp]EKM59680.1 hypothetical protein PHACADRAFT_250327 [Phanerochaete carnosa HHB-10118-sp]